MTVARRTKRRTKLEKQASEVIVDLGTMTQEQVATKYAVQPSSVGQFVARHRGEIEAAQEQLAAKAEDYAIARKVWRIGEAQAQYDAVQAWLLENGLSERTVRWDKDGNEIGETIRLRADALDRLRQYRREVAEELGSLPKQDLTVNIQNNTLNLTWGEEAAALQDVQANVVHPD